MNKVLVNDPRSPAVNVSGLGEIGPRVVPDEVLPAVALVTPILIAVTQASKYFSFIKSYKERK